MSIKVIKSVTDSFSTANGKKQEYRIDFSMRKTLTITINSKSKEIVVKSPKGISLTYIKDFVKSKSSWIEKHTNKIEQVTPASSQNYEAGSYHYILGEPYILEIHASHQNHVSLTDDKRLVVNLTARSNVEGVLKSWYTMIAPNLFIDIFYPLINKFKEKHLVSPSKIEYKYVKRYWGQCTSKRVIRININLIHKPKAAIEYIIIHELCHLVHQNHSKSFWNLVEQEMPNYKQRNNLLKGGI